MEPSKQERYVALVADRKKCRDCADLQNPCDGLRNPSEPDLCLFDSDHIGPWTRLEGDLDARLMVIGQDWGSVRYYVENLGGDLRPNRTDENLAILLQSVGFCGPLTRNQPSRRLFLTNAILCLKGGDMQARIRKEWSLACGRKFVKLQIDIVAPCVVVAMGEVAYRATLAAFEVKRPWPSLRAAADTQEGIALTTKSLLLAVYHCGARVLNSKVRPWDQQLRDWQRVAKALEAERQA